MTAPRDTQQPLAAGDSSQSRAISPWWPHLALLLLFAVYAAFSGPVTHAVFDLFHEGEYLAPQLYFSGEQQELPLLIHGMINYVPASWASGLCAADYGIICTRITNTALVALSSIVWAGGALILTRPKGARTIILLLLIAFLIAVNGHKLHAGAIHQGAPGIRDLLHIPAVILLVLSLRETRFAAVFAAAAGIMTALAIFWAYSRGLPGVAILGLACAAQFYAGRGLQFSLIAPVGFLVTLALLWLVDGAMLAQHLANIAYWAEHRGIWALGESESLAPESWFYFAGFLTLGVAALARSWRDFSAGNRARLGQRLILLAAFAIICVQIVGRPDSGRIYWVMPYAILVLLDLIGPALRGLAAKQEKAANLPILAAVLLIALGINSQFSTPGNSLSQYFTDRTGNLAMLNGEVPNDRQLLGRDIAALMAEVVETGQECTYVMNNAPALYFAAGLPPCTDIMMPVYIGDHAEELRQIEQLRQASPQLIVGHSADWFDVIDGVTIGKRTPTLAAWLEENYPVSAKIDQTELRRRRSHAAPDAALPE